MEEVEEININNEDLNLNHIKNKQTKKEHKEEYKDVQNITENIEHQDASEEEEPDEDEKKMDLIEMIQECRNDELFRESLTDIPEHLSHYSYEQLEKLFKKIKKRLSRSSPMIEHGLNMANTLLERIACSKGFDLEGYAGIMATNRIARRAVRLMSIEYAHKTNLTPQQQYLGVAITTAISMQSINSAKKQVKQQLKLDDPVSDEVMKKYEDI